MSASSARLPSTDLTSSWRVSAWAGLLFHPWAWPRLLTIRAEARSSVIAKCMRCLRVGSLDGYWQPIEQGSTNFGGMRLRPKVCPDCARRGYARAAYAAEASPAVAIGHAEWMHPIR
jgi:hypothetical protein